MRTSKIKAKLKRNEPVLLSTLHLADPALFEMTSLMGFDGIWLDLEHGNTSVATAAQFARAARVGGSDIMIRPAKGEFMRMSRILEIGAQGTCTRVVTMPTRLGRWFAGRNSLPWASAASTAATLTIPIA